jgi:cystathionine beta-lyase/cystathionine gamma-synthase/D-alanyl-D-alanine dipeptidase
LSGEAEELQGVYRGQHTLRPVVGVFVALKDHLDQMPGAASLPFAAGLVVERLEEAAQQLKARTADSDEQIELVLLAAHRTTHEQGQIFEREQRALTERQPRLSEDERDQLLRELVGDPDGVFPFGTGGTIAVSLARNGRLVDMGSPYGDLGGRSAHDYFASNPPGTDAEGLAKRDRELLREVMEDAAFCAHAELWWQYELGTSRWAIARNREVLFDQILPAPIVEGPSARPRTVPLRYPSWRAGVGHPFLDVQEAYDARAGKPGGHYYARISHAGGDDLADLLAREVFDARGVVLTVSGLAAARHAFTALIEEGVDHGAAPLMVDGELVQPTIAFAEDVYQGSKKVCVRIAGKLGWRARKWRLAALLETLESGAGRDLNVKVVYVDSPSNWHLSCYDLGELADAAHKVGAKLMVDVTLQPCQRALEAGADLVICSLSKDISLGYTMAGAVASRDASLLARVVRSTRADGELVTPETAHVVHQHALSVRDRLATQAIKVDTLASMLRAHPAVGEVLTAESPLHDGLKGSQLSFYMDEVSHGLRLERLVGQRSLDPAASLHLAGTFGAVYTTLESARFRSEVSRVQAEPDCAEYKEPRELVRLGLGCERGERIAAELKFALDASQGIAARAIP